MTHMAHMAQHTFQGKLSQPVAVSLPRSPSVTIVLISSPSVKKMFHVRQNRVQERVCSDSSHRLGLQLGICSLKFGFIVAYSG